MANRSFFRRYSLKLFFLIKDIWILLKNVMQSIRRMHIWVSMICWIRYIWYAKILRKIRFYSIDDKLVAKNTISHNYKGLSLLSINAFSGSRPFQLFSILNTIQSIDKRNARVLIVGPRAESEFFIARSFGFKLENLKGLDLISYSPYITLGDMHDIPFEDKSFDIIVLGWVLAYSENPAQACSEFKRVLKTQGVVISGIQYLPENVEEVTEKLGYTPGADRRISSNEMVLKWFSPVVDHVYYNHDITQIRHDKKSELIVCFRIK